MQSCTLNVLSVRPFQLTPPSERSVTAALLWTSTGACPVIQSLLVLLCPTLYSAMRLNVATGSKERKKKKNESKLIPLKQRVSLHLLYCRKHQEFSRTDASWHEFLEVNPLFDRRSIKSVNKRFIKSCCDRLRHKPVPPASPSFFPVVWRVWEPALSPPLQPAAYSFQP